VGKLETDGIIVVDKSQGVTSLSVVRTIKKITQAKKVGHVGTLDPLATGVLPICIGQATRFADYYLDSGKSYLAEIRLGFATDTYDADGRMTNQAKYEHLTFEDFAKRVNLFKGEILQKPPIFSALKKDGVRLYTLAREGIDIDVPSRRVIVHDIAVKKWVPPFLTVEINCGKGFYVRSFAHDLGIQLGSYAHLSQLRRIKSGPFVIESAISIEELASEANWSMAMDSPDKGLLEMNALHLDAFGRNKFQTGQPVSMSKDNLIIEHLEMRRVYSESSCFLGLAKFDSSENVWRAVKVLNSPLFSTYANS